MLQHETKLYIVNHASISYAALCTTKSFFYGTLTCLYDGHHREELFYQLGLRQFGRFMRIRLEPAAPLQDLIHLAVDSLPGHETLAVPIDQIVQVSAFLPLVLLLDQPDCFISPENLQSSHGESLNVG